jgi:phage protein D
MPAPATIPLEIFRGRDFYVPAFRVRVGTGDLRDLPEVMPDIQSVTYTDSLSEIDSVEITVNNWNPDTRKFKYSDEDTFSPGKEIEVFMGYFQSGQDQRRLMLTGDIKTMTPTFPSSGGPTLSVTGLNLLDRFRLQQVTKQFLGKQDTEVARALIKEIRDQVKSSLPNIDLELDETEAQRNLKYEKPIPSLAMDNQYPIMFLLERARRIGYELTITEGTPTSDNKRRLIVHFRPPNYVIRPTYILEWGVSLISFQPSLQTARQVSEVTVRGWNPQEKTEFSETATRDDLRDEKIVNPTDLKVSERNAAQKKEIVADRPIQTKAEAKELAKKTLRQIAQGLVEGKGKTIGLPDLRAGVKLQIRGLGDRFSGTQDKPFSYFVTGTTHTIGDGGYTTDFTARMEAT